jgi:hypothetical protein
MPESDDSVGISCQAVGWLGIATFRALMTFAYFVDSQVYKDLQKSPYYFSLDLMRKEGGVKYISEFWRPPGLVPYPPV